MADTNYAAMSDRELRQYFLDHRDDQAAFHAYMDRRYARPDRTALSPDDPDWQGKFLAVARRQLDNQPMDS